MEEDKKRLGSRWVGWHSLSRQVGEGNQHCSAAKRCPYYKISHPQHPSPPPKSRSLRPRPRDPITENCSTMPDGCQSPLRRGDASSECKAPVTPPTYHMDASLFKFASLTPFPSQHPTRQFLTAAEHGLFWKGCPWTQKQRPFLYTPGDEPQGQQIRKSKPGHNKLRQNGNQHKIVSKRQLIFPVQAVPLMYSNTVSALTLLD